MFAASPKAVSGLKHEIITRNLDNNLDASSIQMIPKIHFHSKQTLLIGNYSYCDLRNKCVFQSDAIKSNWSVQETHGVIYDENVCFSDGEIS